MNSYSGNCGTGYIKLIISAKNENVNFENYKKTYYWLRIQNLTNKSNFMFLLIFSIEEENTKKEEKNKSYFI